jgi:hypothetical protein
MRNTHIWIRKERFWLLNAFITKGFKFLSTKVTRILWVPWWRVENVWCQPITKWISRMVNFNSCVWWCEWHRKWLEKLTNFAISLMSPFASSKQLLASSDNNFCSKWTDSWEFSSLDSEKSFIWKEISK